MDGGKFRSGNVDMENKFSVTVEGGKVVGQDLVVPARGEIKLIYAWPHGHDHGHGQANAHAHGH